MSKVIRFFLTWVSFSIFILVWFLAFGCRQRGADRDLEKLIIFHAGSLAVPFMQIFDAFQRSYPGVEIVHEAAGSRACARKITELHKYCDVMASADYTVIDFLLIPEYADWNIKFASNEMVIAFRKASRWANKIDKDNWYEILQGKKVHFGRSDPNTDPCGYRTVLVIKLAERFYNQPGLAKGLLAKDRRYIRPREVELLALLESGELDFIFIYRSVAEQHELGYLILPDAVNLGKAEFSDYYKTVSVRLTGRRKGTFITKVGEPIIYGVTIPKNAPHGGLAMEFLTFLLDADKGGTILERNGQTFVVPSPTATFDKLPERLRRFAVPEK